MAGKFTLVLILLALLLITVPYLVGFQANDAGYEFGGFLINPIDGNSYLAKMQQGYQGNWKFQLTYSAEPGDGAFLFLFYILLGHLSRLVGLPLIAVFHGARVIASAWLLYMIYRLLRSTFSDKKILLAGFALAGFGSGLGWLAVFAGQFTSDFWVAEAYPFLSMYTNPHFSLGLGLMIFSLLPESAGNLPRSLLAGAALAVVQPFGVVIICLVKGISGVVKVVGNHCSLRDSISQGWFWPDLIFCLSGGLLLLYQFRAILMDPILSQWHQQNITARPDPLDLLLSLLPCLGFGLIGARRAWPSENGKKLVIWGAICLILVFIPWSLQRRFLTGIYLPLAILSVFGLKVLNEKTPIPTRYWLIMLFFLAIPTNLIVITSGFQAINERNPGIFIERGLAESLEWIQANTGKDELVLTDSNAGLYVPAWTGRRVIYGHPFETIDAADELEYLEGLFLEDQADRYYANALGQGGFKVVLIEQEVSETFTNWLSLNWHLVFQSGAHQIYQQK